MEKAKSKQKVTMARAVRTTPSSQRSDPWVHRAWVMTRWMDNGRPLTDGSQPTLLSDASTGAVAAYVLPPPTSLVVGAARPIATSDADLQEAHVIVFRTTLTLQDTLHDLDLRLTPFIGKARVHRGIYRKYLSLRDQLHDAVVQHAPRRLLLTGHSLGGALATMAAADLNAHFQDVTLDVVTFGAPRTGNKEFAALLQSSVNLYVRVSDPVDLVTDLPGVLLGFSHGETDERDSVFSIVSRVGKLLVSMLSTPQRFHFFHVENYYDDSMRSRRAIVHVASPVETDKTTTTTTES